MRKKIRVLDCTLRDGGYVNNWIFGETCIKDIVKAIENIGVDFIEMGLIQDIAYNPQRTIFDNPKRVGEVVGEGKADVIYGALIEMSNYYPQEKLHIREAGCPDVLRYSFWKRLLEDGYNYGKNIVEKGYKLCCQPTRAEQYSEDEFARMCQKFSELEPYGVYIVDTFGLLREDDVVRYAQIANENLAPGVVLGYHSHDNMGQAYRNVCTFLNMDFGKRDIQVDASAFGIGRGAGNLHLEQLLEYLNYRFEANYDLKPIYHIWDEHLSKIMQHHPWGWNLAYFVTAENKCNPNYASYYINKGLNISQIERIVTSITGVDKYLYNDEKAEMFIETVL